MTVQDLIDVLSQCDSKEATVEIRVRDPHDWVLRADVGDVTFDERGHVVVIDAQQQL